MATGVISQNGTVVDPATGQVLATPPNIASLGSVGSQVTVNPDGTVVPMAQPLSMVQPVPLNNAAPAGMANIMPVPQQQTAVTPNPTPTVSAPTSNYGNMAADLTALGLGTMAANPGGIGSFLSSALGIPPITQQALLSATATGLGTAAGVDAANTAATILAGGAANSANILSGAATNAAQINANAAQTAAQQAIGGNVAAMGTVNDTLAKQQQLNQAGVNLGTNSLNNLNTALAPGGSLTTPFQMQDTQAYKFARNQALQQLTNQQGRGGVSLNSDAGQNMATLASNIAGQQEQQAFNQWLAANNLTLASLQAGINSGQVSISAVNDALKQAGISTQTLQQNIGNLQASGTQTAAGDIAGGVTNAANAAAAGTSQVASSLAGGTAQAGNILNQGLSNIGNILGGGTQPASTTVTNTTGGGANTAGTNTTGSTLNTLAGGIGNSVATTGQIGAGTSGSAGSTWDPISGTWTGGAPAGSTAATTPTGTITGASGGVINYPVGNYGLGGTTGSNLSAGGLTNTAVNSGITSGLSNPLTMNQTSTTTPTTGGLTNTTQTPMSSGLYGNSNGNFTMTPALAGYGTGA